MAKRRRISLSDKVRLGPEVAALKARTNPKEWSQFVKDAHARGFTVSGALSGAPDALKERTRSSLVAEANKTVGEAFKPAHEELAQREGKVRALDAKRAADEKHFQAWLATQHESMAARALTADTELSRRQQEIHAQTQQGHAAAQQTAQTNAAAAPGTVSDPAQSKALDLSAEAARANENVANQRQASASMTANAQGLAVASRGVSYGLAQQATTRRASETAAALSAVTADRKEALAKQSAAAAEEIRRLFGVEVEKADANRNYFAAAQQLGVKQDELTLDAAKDQRDERYRRDKLKQDAVVADARIQTDLYRIESSAKQSELDRKLREKLKAVGRDTTVSASDIRQSNNMSSKLGKIASDITGLRRKKTKRPLREVITGRGASSIEYELALDLAVNGRLSAVNRRRALKLGIINPEDL